MSKLDRPTNQSNLAIIRAIHSGPIEAQWNELFSQDWPLGTEIKPLSGRNRIEADIVSSRITRQMMRGVSTKVGDVQRTLRQEIPSLSDRINDITINDLAVTPAGSSGGNFVTAMLHDERLDDEADDIIDVLGSFIGREVERPNYTIEMNLVYLPSTVESPAIRRTEAKIGDLLPITFNHDQATLLPKA